MIVKIILECDIKNILSHILNLKYLPNILLFKIHKTIEHVVNQNLSWKDIGQSDCVKMNLSKMVILSN
jgi:hypothetical protein